MLVPVVMAGGAGSRLWPVSRTLLPKQFIHFPQYAGSLFQQTLGRLEGIAAPGEALVVCHGDHQYLAAEQLAGAGHGGSRILLEPVARNTAPAVAMAALWVLRENPRAVLLVLPADHVIENPANFRQAVEDARALAAENYLVTFGIAPGVPNTGYGYIEKGAPVADTNGFRVARFTEKPDRETAQAYIASGNYFWNSGMFMFSAQGYLDELQTHAADIHDACQAAFAAALATNAAALATNAAALAATSSSNKDADGPLRIPEAEFSRCRGDSIDYAIMEKTGRAAMVTLDAGWNDLGAWDALWETGAKDAAGNVVISGGDVLTEQVSNSYIQAHSRLVAAVGLEDAVIVETPDAVLVSSRHAAQSVKSVVEQLTGAGRGESAAHTRVSRPWGSYESLACRDGYQVKHIIVKPGEALSLQSHRRRAEHWTVIRGRGVVTCDDREITLGVNESTFIPLGSRHRLANPFEETLELIEVQVGDYLGEDDIVRYEDKYGRVEKP